MKREGFTILEVMFALAIFAVITAVFSTALVGSIRQTNTIGEQTQASRMLNFIGRQVAGGQSGFILPEEGSPREWDYGELTDSFPELDQDDAVTDPERFNATITNIGELTFGAADIDIVQYDVQVCYEVAGNERCVNGTTMSASGIATLKGTN